MADLNLRRFHLKLTMLTQCLRCVLCPPSSCNTEASLPFDALRLLAPPVRLVSAALWKVMKQRDVSHYGVLEEFVTSACETVPGLLTVRHQGKLALGLRGRVSLSPRDHTSEARRSLFFCLLLLLFIFSSLRRFKCPVKSMV